MENDSSSIQIRAKYALIRLSNIIKRFPDDIQKDDKFIKAISFSCNDLWEINKKAPIHLIDIITIETLCDDLDYIIAAFEELDNDQI